jgi:hypothetical protein
MQTAARVARVVFLVLAFISYARPSLAGPNWNEYGGSTCKGSIRWLQFSFIDYADYDYGVYDESQCDPGSAGEFGDPSTSAYSRYWHICQAESGTSTFYWSFSCSDEPTEGNVLCTFEDLVNCGS